MLSVQNPLAFTRSGLASPDRGAVQSWEELIMTTLRAAESVTRGEASSRRSIACMVEAYLDCMPEPMRADFGWPEGAVN